MQVTPVRRTRWKLLNIICFLYEYFIAFYNAMLQWTMLQWTFSLPLSSPWCKQQENGDLWPQLLRDILSEKHQAERCHSFHRVSLHLDIFLRAKDRVFSYTCLFAPLLSLYPIWFAVAVLWRNEGSVICFLSRWCWGSKVTRCTAAFHCNLCATNAFTL